MQQIEQLKNAIFFQKNYLLCLHKKLALSREDMFSSRSEYAQNETQIEDFETLMKINKVQNFISTKQAQFNELVNIKLA